LSFVLGASISSQVPGKEMYNNVVRKGWDDEAEWSDMRYLTVDYDFLNLYGVKVLEGRSFKEDFASDKEEALILNESGVQRLGYSSNKDAIGKKLKWQNRKGYVIGVVEDFHFMAANTPVEPFIITMNTAYSAGYLTIKLNTEKTAENISGVENLFHSVLPNQTFDFFFLDNDYDTQYKAEDRFMKIFTAFAIIAIVIACLGLYGLAMFTAEQKFKEIGIRKVLGASIKNLIYIQVKGFLILVLVAFLVSIPITYFSMTQWLESFPSKNQIGFTVFLTSGLGSILIAWVTVSYQSFKASSINPVDSIRSNNG
ncbi:MAG: FtsX-like permease family protein, partial [Fulvivirga sp.]|uniref:ABC transporter permease n=1 Tax=Fulvivirga sp. TaxID=1931237 RepID=UPI0032EF5DB4